MKKKQFQRILTITAAALTLITLSAANPVGGQASGSSNSGGGQELTEPDHKDQDHDESGISPQNDKKPLNNNNE